MSLVGARGACWLRAALSAAALLGPPFVQGCTKPGTTAPPDVPLSLDAVRKGRGAGPFLAQFPQRAAGHVDLALWIDAGARDADPPQVATLAAWFAAEAAGGAVRAQVLPDGIELSLTCKRSELAACLAQLRRGLSARQPARARIAVLNSRLVDARRAADASDPGRAADRLALEALYGGDHAAGLFPLGRAQDDAEATPERVNDFLSQHFGPQRALLIAAGALETDALDEAAATAFAGAARATSERESRRPAPEPEGGVAVDVADATRVSVALSAASLQRAHAAAAALRARLERDREALGLRGSVRGHVFVVRGGALALLRANTGAAQLATRTSAHEVERLRLEGLPAVTLPAAPHDPRALARRLGARWIARAAHPPAPELALGVGALIAGGRADKLSADDPDASVRERAHERLETALEAGRTLGNPRLHGAIEDDAATVTLDNGARLALQHRGGEQVAIAVRFARGAAHEPPLLHGRAALLATLASSACAGLAPEQLHDSVLRLGAELSPRVDGDSFGLLLTAPAASWRAAIALALECALHPGLQRRHLSVARLRLADRLGPEGGPGELAGTAADQVSPSAPGALAPWGSPVRQASVSLANLRELWRESGRGPALSVAIVGPVPLTQAAGWAARRMAELEGTALPAPQPATSAAAHERARGLVDQPTLGLALWRVQGADLDPAGALAFAALVRAAFAQTLGVSAVWHDGGAGADGAWAAVALSGAPEALAAAALGLPRIAAALPRESLMRAADQAVDVAERTRAAQLGHPAGEAEFLARAPFRAVPKASSRERARDLAARIARAEPAWVPLR